MTEPIRAYPLQWPAGWKRRVGGFKDGRFRSRSGHQVGIGDAVLRVREQLQKLGVDDLVISTNVPTRLDGFPRADQREPEDSAAAVYWINKARETRCMAVDIYRRVADNLAAIAATLEAMRAIERHGGAAILDRAFTGFVALAGPAPWWEVLEVPQGAARDVIESAYLRKRSAAHPDRGGSPEAFQRVTQAYQQAINRAN